MVGSYEYGDEPFCSVKGVEFLKWLGVGCHRLLKVMCGVCS